MERVLKILAFALIFLGAFIVYGILVGKENLEARFPEEARMEIFWDLGEAKQQARVESEDASNRAEAREILTQQYEDEVQEAYGLTRGELEQIMLEGFEKNWEAP